MRISSVFFVTGVFSLGIPLDQPKQAPPRLQNTLDEPRPAEYMISSNAPAPNAPGPNAPGSKHSPLENQNHENPYFFPQEELQQADAEMDWTFAYLKSFIHEGSFDDVRFNKKSQILSTHIMQIGDWVKFQKGSQDLRQRLQHIQHIFNQMELAATYMDYLRDEKYIDQYMARSLVQANIGLLALFNRYGIPDPTAAMYLKIVYQLRRTLQRWENWFRSLQTVTDGVGFIFDTQLVKAQTTLDTLAKLHPILHPPHPFTVSK